MDSFIKKQTVVLIQNNLISINPANPFILNDSQKVKHNASDSISLSIEKQSNNWRID